MQSYGIFPKETGKSNTIRNKSGAALNDNRIARVATASVNNTGLPDGLKTSIEALSGHSLDDVRVHYNSSKPEQLSAYAYTQGSQIHLGPGQERHLPHEAWHVVQQKQGRVAPTIQMKDGLGVNDSSHLEHEASVMGGKAEALTPVTGTTPEFTKGVVRPTIQMARGQGRSAYRPGGRDFGRTAARQIRQPNKLEQRGVAGRETGTSQVPEFKLKFASVIQTRSLLSYERRSILLESILEKLSGNKANQLISLYRARASTSDIQTLLKIDCNGDNLLRLLQTAGNFNGSAAEVASLVVAAPAGVTTATLIASIRLLAGKGNFTQFLQLFVRARRHNATIQQIDQLLVAAPAAASTASDLDTLLNSLSGRGTFSQCLQLLLTARMLHAPVLAINQLLINAPAGVNTANELNALLTTLNGKGAFTQGLQMFLAGRARGGSVPDIDQLLASAPANANTADELCTLLITLKGKGNFAQGLQLIQTGLARGGSLSDIDRLLSNAPANANAATDLNTLLTTLNGKGTFAQGLQMFLTGRARGGSVPEIDRLLSNAPANANAATELNALLTTLNGKGTFAEGLQLFLTARALQATVLDIDRLLSNAPANANTATDLNTLLTTLNGKGTFAQGLQMFLTGRARGGSVPDIDRLLASAPVGATTATELNTLLTTLNGRGTFGQGLQMFLTGRARGGSVPDIDRALANAPVGATTATELNTLLTTLNGRGTFAQGLRTFLTGRAQGGSVLDINQLLANAPAGANAANDLNNLLGVIANKGTVNATAQLVGTAAGRGTLTQVRQMVISCPVGNTAINDLTAALARDAMNTPGNIRALLLAMHTQTLARFNRLISTRNFFNQNLAPGIPAGQPAVMRRNGTLPQIALFNNWLHVLQRHTFENFVFAQANHRQGFFPPNNAYQGVRNIVQPSWNLMTPAQVQQINTSNNVVINNYFFASNSNTPWVASIYPLTAAAYIEIFQAEAAALNNLR